MLRNLAINSEVVVSTMTNEKTPKRVEKNATVIEVVTPTAARVAFDKAGNHTALVSHSLKGEANTFRYPDEKLDTAATAAPATPNGAGQ